MQELHPLTSDTDAGGEATPLPLSPSGTPALLVSLTPERHCLLFAEEVSVRSSRRETRVGILHSDTRSCGSSLSHGRLCSFQSSGYILYGDTFSYVADADVYPA